MSKYDLDDLLSRVADDRFNGSFFDVFYAAWGDWKGIPPDKYDVGIIEFKLTEYLHGGELPDFVVRYILL